MKILPKKCTIAFFLRVSLLFLMTLPSLAMHSIPRCGLGEKVCGGICYKPIEICSCAGEAYNVCSPEGDVFQQCCEGLFICPCNKGDRLCGGTQCYNPQTRGCCGGTTPYSRLWEGCCEGTSYLLQYETCCNNQIVPKEACCCNKIIDPETEGCCNGVIYDLASQACCQGKVVAGIPYVLLTPTGQEGKCCVRDPSCFYAILDDASEPIFAEMCDSQGIIYFPRAICPDVSVQVYQLGGCGPKKKITHCSKGFRLEGVCPW
jgi:hypothetical protein